MPGGRALAGTPAQLSGGGGLGPLEQAANAQARNESDGVKRNMSTSLARGIVTPFSRLVRDR